jgi:hypothetical protein
LTHLAGPEVDFKHEETRKLCLTKSRVGVAPVYRILEVCRAIRHRDEERTSPATVYGAGTRSASRGTLVFVNKPTEPVASVHPAWWRISPTLDRWPTIGRRELQAAMRSMTVVMVDKRSQDSFKMSGAPNQQPV